MLLVMLVSMMVQTPAAAGGQPINIPELALRDPYGFVLSHCSPLARRSSESLEACESRVGEALRTRLPDFRPRPPSTLVASGADDPLAAGTGSAFGGRCTTRQESERDPDGGSSSSSGRIVCGDPGAADLLENLMRPQ